MNILDAQAIAKLDPVEFARRPGNPVTAVRLTLETDGFHYQKWGSEQKCKQGDWLVHSEQGATYTIDAETFAATYAPCGPGQFYKTQGVWACVMETGGAIRTKDGLSHFAPGDFIVFNNEDRTDAYPLERSKFEAFYTESVTEPEPEPEPGDLGLDDFCAVIDAAELLLQAFDTGDDLENAVQAVHAACVAGQFRTCEDCGSYVQDVGEGCPDCNIGNIGKLAAAEKIVTTAQLCLDLGSDAGWLEIGEAIASLYARREEIASLVHKHACQGCMTGILSREEIARRDGVQSGPDAVSYPLWCVDSGEPDEERYLGPFATAEAAQAAGEKWERGGEIRRCRRSPLPMGVLSVLFQTHLDAPEIDQMLIEYAMDFPEGTWANWEAELVESLDEATFQERVRSAVEECSKRRIFECEPHASVEQSASSPSEVPK